MRLIEDVCCIILLVFLPYSILEKFGLFRSMEIIVNRRQSWENVKGAVARSSGS